ncbi:hypothetical protein [Azospirillum rugosum]|uniref:Acetolactate synthase regulatory subunit n=1 Tax=Azospirillum rugosum TaxID=416170 RepID=A0ABS4SNM5_9PROT|nr:hypothetical protein [Azospirillum rugosum]MBP2293527.1 acetolactate synthase regulatory subunit [Azospirillum rugosum]MDQ0529206.1 acetolactate synthase regulatory subunit [Azospirillum rugosum]
MSTVVLAAPAAESRPTDPNRCVAFTVEADADPGTLPRVLELFAKRGLVPLSLTSQLLGDRLTVGVEVVGMVQAESNHVGNCLRQIPMVSQVSVTDRTLPNDLPAAAD